MRVWRVENEAREGPFTGGKYCERALLRDEINEAMASLYRPDHNCMMEYPDYSHDDFVRGLQPYPCLFGCASREQLLHWFPEPVLALLRLRGFRVRVYEAESFLKSSHQVVFDPASELIYEA